jgi:hypothetical protein
MKKSHLLVLTIVSLVLLSLSSSESAQVQPFDLKKCRQELEIMKGILKTTLSFASREVAGKPGSERESGSRTIAVLVGGGEFSNISAFYLSGQGAVFTIPTSALRDLLRVRKEFNLKNAFKFGPGAFDFKFTGIDQEYLEDLAEQAEDLAELAIEGAFTPEPPEPPAANQAPRPPAPPAAPKDPRTPAHPEKLEQTRQKLADLQEKARKKMEEDEARRARFQETVEKLKVYLIEALANHGDSMSVVKPNEYVNIVILDDGRGFWMVDSPGGDRGQRQVISVQKSVISDYKAGRLTLDGFKAKVLEYVN